MRTNQEKTVMVEKKELVPLIKCDRCSNQIEAEKLYPGLLFSNEMRGWGQIVIGSSNKEYDLCPECVKKLEVFIENKEDSECDT